MRRLALLAALALAAPAALHARAGGGDNYSSGSSGSSESSGSSYSSSHDHGGSGSSSGGGNVPLTPGETRFMVIAVAAGLVLMLVNARMQSGLNSRRDARIAAGTGVQAFQAADPGFVPALFLPRAEKVFTRVQEAWSAGDMTPVCHLLSDGVFERFQLLLELQRREGRVNKLEDLDVVKVSLAMARPGGRYDALDARVVASCTDRYLSAKDGSLIKEDDSSFVEYWSFLRSAAARGRGGQGLAEGLCPNCGAGLAVNAAAVCSQCKSWVNSGEFDWVLAEITQESEWDPAASPAAALAALSHDPETTAQGLEDRASMLFWRWQRCLADGNLTALEGWCSESGLAAVRASAQGKRAYLDCGVGSVEVRRARAEDGKEEVPVVVLWAGREGGAAEPSRKCRSVITLSRKAGVRAVPAAALRSAHCAGCGAAIPPAAAACEHCGRGFKDPSVDWVVADLKTSDV